MQKARHLPGNRCVGGRASAVEGYGKWGLALLNVASFALFLAFLPFYRKVQARQAKGIYLGFIVSLFCEMYGFPLTAYVLTWAIGRSPRAGVLPPLYMYGAEGLYPVLGGMGLVLLLTGMALIVLGWAAVYRAQGDLVTSGLYACVRHPQYLGFILMTFGMLLQWPTLPVLIMWPVLTRTYYRLCLTEERELVASFGERYVRYQQRVPMLLPGPGRLGRRR